MARKSKEPTCSACGVSWVDHKGIIGICAENAELKRQFHKIKKAVMAVCVKNYRLTAQLQRAREENKLLRQSLGIQRLLRAIRNPRLRFELPPTPRLRRTSRRGKPAV